MNGAANTLTDDANRKAREAALQAATAVTAEATSLISFSSSGRLLIIGDYQSALDAAKMLPEGLRCCILATDAVKNMAQQELTVFFGRREAIELSGHFGEFTATLATEQGMVDVAQAAERGNTHFDLILDLGTPPLWSMEVPPLGYYAPDDDQERLTQMLTELPEMIGEFQKAKFFIYDPDICAHGNSGLQGCRRCIDACPTAAITSLGERIAVDPYYCQGGGSCATACPSGAIIYAYPKPADTVDRLRVLLRTYREAGGEHPILLFHDAQTGSALLSSLSNPLPGHIIPIEVEEIGSIGMDSWLSALAFGARTVLLLTTEQTPPSVRQEFDQQLGFVHAILAGMGYPEEALRCLTPTAQCLATTSLTAGAAMPVLEAAGFAGANAKRDTVFFAIDWLLQQAPRPQDHTELPVQSPFGEITVNRDACTLCMACVSVCPVAALADGGDTPRLDFLEANCVQCGLCRQACPENAIDLHPRFDFDHQRRHRHRALNEEKPFHCISCGVPFATRSMIETMTAKLRGHSMFQDETAIKRLQMCGDCRIRDMLQNDDNILQ